MSRGRTERFLARTLNGGPGGRVPEELVVEEPLEIRLGEDLVATTMRTPGHDFELAVGFLWAEQLLLGSPAEVRYCATGSATDTGFNVVTVDPGRNPLPIDHRPSARLGLTSSSCGICGAEQVEALVERLAPLPAAPDLPAAVLTEAGSAAARHQELFARTGGAHAAAVLDREGEVQLAREDIGRHNAVDKVVGCLLLDDDLPRPAEAEGARTLWVSGRASFEIVQKAWAAGFSSLVAVGAVSAMAARTAQRAGLVLVGFSREGRATVYAGGDSLPSILADSSDTDGSDAGSADTGRADS